MSQSAVVRDYRALETGRRRANRLVLTMCVKDARLRDNGSIRKRQVGAPLGAPEEFARRLGF